MCIFHAGIEHTVHKAGRTRVRRQDVWHLTLKKEHVARPVCGRRKSTTESVGHFVRRIVFRIHGDRQINELIVCLVFDREPDGLDAIFRQFLPKAAPTFIGSERARTYPYAGGSLLLRSGDKIRIAARVWRKPERIYGDGRPRQYTEQERHNSGLVKSRPIHGHRYPCRKSKLGHIVVHPRSAWGARDRSSGCQWKWLRPSSTRCEDGSGWESRVAPLVGAAMGS